MSNHSTLQLLLIKSLQVIKALKLTQTLAAVYMLDPCIHPVAKGCYCLLTEVPVVGDGAVGGEDM